MSTSPSVGTAKPATHASVVVLPEPDGPSSVRNSPARTVSVTPSTARTAPNVLTTPSRRTSAPFGIGAPILRLLLAEVGLAHEIRAHERGGRVVQHHAPRLNDITAVCDAQCHARVLLDEKDRGALTVDVLDDAKDRLDQDRRQPHRRLVEQQQARPRHQRPADGEHLLLAAG